MVGWMDGLVALYLCRYFFFGFTIFFAIALSKGTWDVQKLSFVVDLDNAAVVVGVTADSLVADKVTNVTLVWGFS